LALALRVARWEAANKATKLRRDRGKLGDATASDGYLHGEDFLKFQTQLEAVERAIAGI